MSKFIELDDAIVNGDKISHIDLCSGGNSSYTIYLYFDNGKYITCGSYLDIALAHRKMKEIIGKIQGNVDSVGV